MKTAKIAKQTVGPNLQWKEKPLVFDRRDMQFVEDACYQIYRKLYTEHYKGRAKNWKDAPDTIIGVARGGWPIARLMCDRFARPKPVRNPKTGEWKVKIVSPNLINIGVKHYEGTGVGKANFFQGLTNEVGNRDVKGKSIMIVDDIYDTGITLLDIRNYLRDNGWTPKEWIVVVLDVKRVPFCATRSEWDKKLQNRLSADKAIVEPGKLCYYNDIDNRKSDRWTLYPWEAKEGSYEVIKAFGMEKFDDTELGKVVPKELINEISANAKSKLARAEHAVERFNRRRLPIEKTKTKSKRD